jgi:hypothetical protein
MKLIFLYLLLFGCCPDCELARFVMTLYLFHIVCYADLTHILLPYRCLVLQFVLFIGVVPLYWCYFFVSGVVP